MEEINMKVLTICALVRYSVFGFLGGFGVFFLMKKLFKMSKKNSRCNVRNR